MHNESTGQRIDYRITSSDRLVDHEICLHLQSVGSFLGFLKISHERYPYALCSSYLYYYYLNQSFISSYNLLLSIHMYNIFIKRVS